MSPPEACRAAPPSGFGRRPGGPAPGRPGLRHAHSAGLDSRQEEAFSRSMGIGTTPERWGFSEKRRHGVRESRRSSMFSRFRGAVQKGPAQRQETQIVQP